MSALRPLFRFDPGWLFTVAGLTIMVVSALLPAQQDVAILQEQLAKLEHEEIVNQKRMGAYTQFLVELKAQDPSLLTRLAASQLNLMPKGEEPVLMATSIEHTVSDWIEATVPPEAFELSLVPDTLLTRLASGQRRLWLMGGGALIVFIGLTTGIPLTPSTRFVPTAQEVQWLEQAQKASTNAGDAPLEIALQADADQPPDGRISSDDEFEMPLEMPTDFLSETVVAEQTGLAEQVAGEVAGHSSSQFAAESIMEIHDEMADGKWVWNEDANEQPYMLVSPAESANSIAGNSESTAGGESEELWPHAAD